MKITYTPICVGHGGNEALLVKHGGRLMAILGICENAVYLMSGYEPPLDNIYIEWPTLDEAKAEMKVICGDYEGMDTKRTASEAAGAGA